MQVLGVNTGDPLADLEVFVSAFQMSFPVLISGGPVYNMYRQAGATSPYPLDYIIDQAGNVAYFKTEYDPEAMIANIDALLGNSPDLVVTPGSLAFGEVPLGRSESMLLGIGNSGLGDLQIQSLTTGTSAFTVNQTTLVVPPGTQRSLLVTFTPASLDLHEDILTIGSNDPDNPELLVPLTGMGQAPTGVDNLPPQALRLSNVPNPFNPSTRIRFNLPRAAVINLKI